MKQPILFIFDLILINTAIYLAGTILGVTKLPIVNHTGASVFTMVSSVTFFYISGLYDFRRMTANSDIFIRSVISILVANAIVASWFYILGHWQFPTKLFAIQIIFTTAFTPIIRILFVKFFDRFESEKTLLLGYGPAGKAVLIAMKNPNVIILDDDPNLSDENGTVSGSSAKIAESCESNNIKKIIYALNQNDDDHINEQLMAARLNGIAISSMSLEYEKLMKKIPVEHIHDHWIVFESGFSLYSKQYVQRIKRIIDISLSIFGLIITAPICLITAIIIKLESRGPIIFKQTRVGLGDKEFTVYKFRSMAQDAEKDGAKWAEKNDARVTKFGKIIRKFRIDELPQFWNILIGDMSLIGPRPEQPAFVRQLEKRIPYYSIRHTIKPGLSGWAQINYPYGATEEDALNKLEYELYYIKNMSVLLEIKIILKTIGVMIFGQGAR